ncbi:MAG: hypothetical protein NT047_03300 [Deltaproteobacteria bacterium]|nr:hypothetical protein [Deltaproteobacteria bacterium]
MTLKAKPGKESHEIRHISPLGDLLHGLFVVRALSVLPGLDCGYNT